MYLLPLIIIFVILCYFISYLVERKYERFVREHSLSIRTLKELNQKYVFHVISTFDLKHAYDNENFYSEISPKDYLIYQLVYIQNKVKQSIDHTYDNRKLYRLYQEDIRNFCIFNQYDTNHCPKNFKKLSEIEKNIFDSFILEPTLDFHIQVSLRLTNIHGVRYDEKNSIFDIQEIEKMIEWLNQKSNGFYLRDDIWQAICRVERGKVSNKMRFAIYKRDNYRCRKCGRQDNLEIDHIFPISKGGKSQFDNLQTLCHTCNVAKSNTIERGAVNPHSQYHLGISEICPLCGASLVVRHGKYGAFYGCSNYPNCKFTKNC